MTAPSRRTLVVLATTAAVLGMTPVMLAAALLGQDEGPAPAPASATVLRVDQLAAAGRWSDAFAEIDFAAKGRSLVPDLWDAGTESERGELIEVLRGVFVDTSARVREDKDFQRGWTLWEMATGPSTALVEQVTTAEDGHEKAVRWWLERRDGRWVIVDRTFRDGITHNEPSGVVRVMRARIAEAVGHPPTLREFVDNAPSWIGRIRTHRITITDEMLKTR